MRGTDGQASALDRVGGSRNLGTFQQPDELRQREGPLSSRAGLDDRGGDVDALEAEYEVGHSEVLAAQRPRTMLRDVDFEPLGGDEGFPKRGLGPEVVKPVRVELDRQVGRERTKQALRERAPKPIAGTDQVEAEDRSSVGSAR